MLLLNPKTEKFEHLDEKSRELMSKTIAFFEEKGKTNLLEEDKKLVWPEDFFEFLKKEKVFANLLTPPAYGPGDTAWNTFRNCDFNEILGFYGLSYWYAWQVTILGLGPIWMSGNEAVKQKTGRLLQEGGIFAFGLSEKAHGADLYSTEMMLTPLGNGRWIADGGKYYIGNGNKAALVSVFGKDSETGDYVFFVVESDHENYECVKNVVAGQKYVAELALSGYPVSDEDILAHGPEAWDMALNTVNVGKYNLGWAAVGICTHALFEALNHAAHRNLYGRFVTDFPHIRQLFTEGFARLAAMKLFSARSSDYQRVGSASDRRYLLYNALEKMKVTTQGEEVINLIWDVIAAKGFEKDTYFENAAREIRGLPKLEGTVHVNMALVNKFAVNFLFQPEEFPPVPKKNEPGHDEFLFNQGPTKGLGGVKFHDYRQAFDALSLPNLALFKEQVETFSKMLASAPPDQTLMRDIDFMLVMGEMFTLIPYAQLIIEEAVMRDLDPDLVDQIFDFLVQDMSKFAVRLHGKPGTSADQMKHCLEIIQKPAVDPDRFGRVWDNHIKPLIDAYEMNS